MGIKMEVPLNGRPSRGRYQFPIRLDPKVASEEGGRLAEIALSSGKKVGRIGPFHWSDSEFHTGIHENAIDFLVPDGTEIVSPAHGWVDSFWQISSRWGTDKERDRWYFNYLILRLTRGEYALIGHLEQSFATTFGLSAGSEVAQGQPIARSGKTGCLTGGHPQLHFEIFTFDKGPDKRIWESLVPQFNDL